MRTSEVVLASVEQFFGNGFEFCGVHDTHDLYNAADEMSTTVKKVIARTTP